MATSDPEKAETKKDTGPQRTLGCKDHKELSELLAKRGVTVSAGDLKKLNKGELLACEDWAKGGSESKPYCIR